MSLNNTQVHPVNNSNNKDVDNVKKGTTQRAPSTTKKASVPEETPLQNCKLEAKLCCDTPQTYVVCIVSLIWLCLNIGCYIFFDEIIFPHYFQLRPRFMVDFNQSYYRQVTKGIDNSYDLYDTRNISSFNIYVEECNLRVYPYKNNNNDMDARTIKLGQNRNLLVGLDIVQGFHDSANRKADKKLADSFKRGNENTRGLISFKSSCSTSTSICTMRIIRDDRYNRNY